MLSETNSFSGTSTTKRTVFCAIAVVLALGLSSCGRKGALEAPPSETIVTIDENGKEVKKKKPKEDKPFILDGAFWLALKHSRSKG